jgi:hypothetical protein
MLNKIKLFLIFFLVLSFTLSLSACTISSSNLNNDFGKIATISDKTVSSDIVFYYSNTCPHCKVVEDFIVKNKISEKVFFKSQEVGENTDNASDLASKAAKCGIKQDEIGVPLLWDGSQCYIGQDEVIDFFKSKTNVK